MKLNRHLDLLAMLFGLCAAVVGAVGATAALLGAPAFSQSSGGAQGGTIAAAIAVALGGVAVMTAAVPPGRVSRRMSGIAGAIVALIGIAALADSVLGLHLGIGVPALQATLGLADAPAGGVAPALAACLIVLGTGITALQFVRERRAAILLTIAATGCGAFGAISLAGYLLNVEFMVSWLHGDPLPPQAALAVALLGAGLCSVVLHHAKLSVGAVDESRTIVLTAVWMLSVIAVIAGVSTFAMAQYEYQDAVRADLAHTLRERRAFLEYAIGEHVQQVRLGSRPAFAASVGDAHRIAATRSIQNRLQEAAEVLRESGFSGWRFKFGATTVSAGEFVERPDLAIPLAGSARTDLLLKDGRYFLRTRMPIRDRDTVVGEALAEEPFPALTHLKQEADSWGGSGEMALCSAAGTGQMDCVPVRTHPAAGRFLRDVQGRPSPMGLALDNETGVADMLDYRHRRVLAAFGPVGQTGLGMVIKIDTAELN
ncbi:MAG: hypothetical protein ABJB78_07235, partial [Betaproteobacteria bacterium]